MKLRENTLFTGKHYVFGMHVKEIKEQIDLLSDNINIGKLGVHFHRKTQNVSEWNLKFELENVLTDETLNDIDLLNIGGGIPIKYKNFRADVLNSIYKEIKGLREFLDKYNIKLIIEYDGTGFNGWQAQVNGKRLRTIQEEIEKALVNIFTK